MNGTTNRKMTNHFGIRYSLKPIYFTNNMYNGMPFLKRLIAT